MWPSPEPIFKITRPGHGIDRTTAICSASTTDGSASVFQRRTLHNTATGSRSVHEVEPTGRCLTVSARVSLSQLRTHGCCCPSIAASRDSDAGRSSRRGNASDAHTTGRRESGNPRAFATGRACGSSRDASGPEDTRRNLVFCA